MYLFNTLHERCHQLLKMIEYAKHSLQNSQKARY